MIALSKNYAKNFCIYVLLFIIVSFSICSILQTKNKAFAEHASSAKAMLVLEAESGRILFNKNGNEKLPMASTTKIVTALTVLDNCKNINEEVKINDKAIGIPGTSIYLKHGESMTVKELLYGMMLPSGNDASTALAYHVAGGISEFCELMQKTALGVGANNSSFANPHGLDADNHYTTAYDLALITAKALENEVFREIVTTKSTRIKGSTQGSYRYLKNKNKLLNTLDGCVGVKTGFTNKAGRCLVSATERDGMTLVCVCLNCGPMFEESENLLNYLNNEYSNQIILPEYKIIRSISVLGGAFDSVKVFSKREFKYPLTKDEFSRLEYRYDLPNFLNAPVKKDDVVGKLEIYLDKHLLFSEKIYTINSIKKIGVWSNIQDIISNW